MQVITEPPLDNMEVMLDRALCILRKVRGLRRVSAEQLEEFIICKAALTRFSHIPNMERHFIKHFVVNEQLLRLMDDMYLIVR